MCVVGFIYLFIYFKVLGDTSPDQDLHLQGLQVCLIPSQVGQNPTPYVQTPFYTPILNMSRVSSGGSAYSSAALQNSVTNIYFPKTDGVMFEQANATQIMCKSSPQSERILS